MRDVYTRYLAGGTWHKDIIKKKNKGSQTKAGRGSTYIAVPPVEGWPGGDPIKNGFRP